jgi:hypothetical protein
MKNKDLFENISFKKLAVLTLLVILVFAVLREIIFWSFVSDFRKSTNSFNNQFDQEQKSIQQQIGSFKDRAKEFTDVMNTKENRFHSKVNKALDDATIFQAETAATMAKEEEKLDRDFREFPERAAKKEEQFAKEQSVILKKQLKEHEAQREKDYAEEHKRELAADNTYKLSKAREDKKAWDEARIRYFKKTGTKLPSYEEFKNDSDKN